MSDKTLTTVELAARWGMHPGSLVNWRTFQRGPKYIKLGTEVRYRLEDVEAYEKKNVVSAPALPKKRKRRAPKKRKRRAS